LRPIASSAYDVAQPPCVNPPCVVVRPVGRLHHAVERHALEHDDLGHRSILLFAASPEASGVEPPSTDYRWWRRPFVEATVELCLMIEGQEGVGWPQWVALADACEQHGLSDLFRSDHYVSFDAPEERGGLDAWATLAALAAVTERIRLATMVSPVTFRHPAMLARQVRLPDPPPGGPCGPPRVDGSEHRWSLRTLAR
jgi:hypothetical protein